MTIPCDKEVAITSIQNDLTIIKSDVKELLEMKNKIIGGIRVLTIMMSVIGFIIGSLISILKG